VDVHPHICPIEMDIDRIHQPLPRPGIDDGFIDKSDESVRLVFGIVQTPLPARRHVA